MEYMQLHATYAKIHTLDKLTALLRGECPQKHMEKQQN